MLVDASAIVAILTDEPGAERLADALDKATNPVTSAIAVLEATLGLRRKHHASVQEAREDVVEFFRLGRFEIVNLSGVEADAALIAFCRVMRFGT